MKKQTDPLAWQEEEANYFALRLLLPRKPFIKTYNRLLETREYNIAQKLAALFGVEEHLIGQRIQSLRK